MLSSLRPLFLLDNLVKVRVVSPIFSDFVLVFGIIQTFFLTFCASAFCGSAFIFARNLATRSADDDFLAGWDVLSFVSLLLKDEPIHGSLTVRGLMLNQLLVEAL